MCYWLSTSYIHLIIIVPLIYHVCAKRYDFPVIHLPFGISLIRANASIKFSCFEFWLNFDAIDAETSSTTTTTNNANVIKRQKAPFPHTLHCSPGKCAKKTSVPLSQYFLIRLLCLSFIFELFNSFSLFRMPLSRNTMSRLVCANGYSSHR